MNGTFLTLLSHDELSCWKLNQTRIVCSITSYGLKSDLKNNWSHSMLQDGDPEDQSCKELCSILC